MSEQSSPEIKNVAPRKKYPLLKSVTKKLAPVIIAAVAAFSPDSKAVLPTPVTPNTISSEQGQKEAEKIPFKPQVTIIDAGLSAPREGIIQNEFFSNEDLAKKILGSAYLSKEQIGKDFGHPINWMSPDAKHAAEKTKKYKQVMTHAFIERYFSHGDKVVGAMEEVWNKAGLKSTGVELIPLQKIFDMSSVKEIQDSLGNQGVSISFNPQRIIELLSTDTNRVVNMSFQVGDIDLLFSKYDFPSIEIVGAYDREKARENLPKLFAVANAYPDKLFFAAAGNEGEDFEETLRELKDQKPKNLIIVGQWTGNYGPTNQVFGADIYVDNGKLGILDGSSFSTPVLTAYAEILSRQGLSQDEVLGKIKASSHQEDYDFDLPDIAKKGKAMVFDPNLP